MNSLLMILTLIAGYVLIAFITNKPTKRSNDYMEAIIDKHRRVREIKRPKIILCGGSNLAFGINSQEIQNEFDVPVVNLGLHAGLGLEFMLNELKASMNEGDVVILSIEYFLGDEDYDLKDYMQKMYPEASHFYSKSIVKDFQQSIEETRKNLKSFNNRKPIDTSFSVYSRAGFNMYGDLVSHLQQPPPKELRQAKLLNYKYWDGIEILNDFYKYAQTKNVNVFFAFPNFASSEYKKNQMAINKLYDDIQKNLLIEVINTPEDLVLNDSLFYDTIYHLNSEGRELRTNKLIESIKKSTKALKCVSAIRDSVGLQSI